MMLKIIRTLSRNSLCLWQVTWVIREYNALIWDNQWHTQWFYDLRCMLSCFSCVWLFVTPWTQQATDVISQARILEWVAVPASRGSSRLSDWARISYVSCTASRFFTTSATWKPQIIWGGGLDYKLVVIWIPHYSETISSYSPKFWQPSSSSFSQTLSEDAEFRPSFQVYKFPGVGCGGGGGLQCFQTDIGSRSSLSEMG